MHRVKGIMMKAVCISNFNYYDKRIKSVDNYLTAKGYEVMYMTGNYDTMTRQLYTLDHPRVIQFPIIQYRKNISFERLRSHYDFAKNVYEQLNQIKPDLIYLMVPPNVVPFMVSKYKKKYPNTRVICDVFDMWPETFPSTRKGLLAIPFLFWRQLRTSGLKCADVIVTECQMFSDYLKKTHAQPIVTCYPKQQAQDLPITYDCQESERIGLCYLGSINNIIDIPKIAQIVESVSRVKRVDFHVIGTGEKKDALLSALKPYCQTVYDHGKVYDPVVKQQIFNRCAFGVNVLKTSVFIGLTLKTIDYFNGGLPVLNTVPGDTADWLTTYGAGIQLESHVDVSEKVSQLTIQDIRQMKQQARALFDRFFDLRHTQSDLDKIFIELKGIEE